MDPTLLIGDIVERGDDKQTKPLDLDFSAKPVSATGFPLHKKRWKSSAFKQQRAGKPVGNDSPDLHTASGAETELRGSTKKQVSFADTERRRIDEENRQRLDNMSPEEIAQAQDDLMNGLNPDLVKRLLQRAHIDDAASEPSPFDPPPSERPVAAGPVPEIQISDTTNTEDREDEQPASQRPVSTKKIADDYDEDREPTQIPSDLFPITDPPPKNTHFPTAARLPDLDPSDPNFLESLHKKYFPDLAADPSKLAWMAPVPTENSPADQDSPYYPHPEISISALRFDFRGRFLSPRVSRSISSAKGLHHHGEAPEAAGYTIAELARLARSAVPAQRCIAFQTLGRIMYRLGRGEWGKTQNDAIAVGVWDAVKKGRVLDTLMEAAVNEGGHRSSRAFATEALWLFEKGGWKEKFQGR